MTRRVLATIAENLRAAATAEAAPDGARPADDEERYESCGLPRWSAQWIFYALKSC
jgi:hypothetical protein